jgi:hypothetical protein
MHKGKKHKEISVMEGYNDFARSEGAEAKKYVDSIRKNNPFAKGIDDMMDEESRRRERGYYVEGTVMKSPKTTSEKEQGMSRESSHSIHVGTALSKGGKAIGRGIKEGLNTTIGEVAEKAVKIGKSAIEAQSGASAIKAGFKIIGGFKLPHMNKTGKSPHMHETIHKKL